MIVRLHMKFPLEEGFSFFTTCMRKTFKKVRKQTLQTSETIDSACFVAFL